ncbi:tripartite tricarboxylate transporter substrate binding protein [Limnohabitans sp. Rim8]|uniref:Bug family tripartite tricarboxylate transporter substrate binding protein n=1 Tax=Limnohabitans sp. Rim8 TaxID=1100718 RepID=UPI00262CD583|nr:tripartite tricarboxylate transporter substrate binding protein [Limnohabitans sp. Rim8]
MIFSLPQHRSLLRQLGLGLVTLAAGLAMAADPYPTKSITIVNPWAAGGPSDAIIRPIAQQLSARLGQAVVVDNRAGATGTIGAAAVAKATPDGHTLFFAHVNPIAISPSLPQKLPYDPIKDFAPITLISSGPAVLVVRSDFPAKNLAEFIAYARANPGKVSYGSVGIGSNTHLAGSLLGHMSKTDMLHVPYKGSANIQTDILGGSLTTGFVTLSGAQGLIQDGRMRALAVSTAKRSSVLPDVPAVAEMLPGFEISGWYGLMAPANTPPQVIRRLNAEVTAILRTPEMSTRLRDGGMESTPTTPEAFGEYIKAELVRWVNAIKVANIKE